MPRDDWATPRSALRKSAQRWFGRLIGLVVPLHAWLALATNGRISPSLFWRPGIILETTGRKSGLRRRAVITYLPDDDRIVLVASNYGRAGNPSWYENLLADPHVRVIRRGQSLPYVARVATGDERRSLLKRTDDVTYGVYAAYSRKTDREIPVVVLTPAA
ncbi:MAG: nitroreductase/quinone reductase family protein [Candidatus Limnocylindrus sp.]|jgi:deazaflavin-dependent oxidoreductase (nitroreductase family)